MTPTGTTLHTSLLSKLSDTLVLLWTAAAVVYERWQWGRYARRAGMVRP